MDVDTLEVLARELLGVPDYRHRTLQVSRQMHARKNPAAVAADAMEQLMAFGGQHLRPHAAYSLNFVQFYMLDVLLALYLTLVIAILLFCKCLLSFVTCAAHNIFAQKDLRNKHKLE